MDRWRRRVAVVTGASSGIGAAIACQLQDAGVHVVGLDKTIDKLTEAVETARKEAQSRNISSLGKSSSRGKLHRVKCDVTKEEDVLAAFKWIKDNTNGVNILVNNAGVVGDSPLTESTTEEWRRVLDVNVVGLSMCTREAIRQMRERAIKDCHIINMCSVAGHFLPYVPAIAMYGGSKHAVRIITEGLRQELEAAKSIIRVSEVSPWYVKTKLFDSLKQTTLDKLQSLSGPYLFPEDVADAVLYVLSTPSHVQIDEIIVRPVNDGKETL